MAETKIIGTTHSAEGATLLAAWGLPMSIVEAVLVHESPDWIDTEALGIAATVHFAQRLTENPEFAITNEPPPHSGRQLSGSYLAQLEIDESTLDCWRGYARTA